VFLGDLVDRGPDSPGVLRLVMGMVTAGTALCVPGNHEQKLLRKLRGRKVAISHGLAETLAQLDNESPQFVGSAAAWIDGLVSHLRLDAGRLVVAHAGLKEEYPRPRLRAGPRLLPVWGIHWGDRRVRPAGSLPVGQRLPRIGDGRLRPRAHHEGRVGQQHDLPGLRPPSTCTPVTVQLVPGSQVCPAWSCVSASRALRPCLRAVDR
jgi:Calcineurin-like phosphoesterase